MNFERGQDPKHAMGIGNEANPVEVMDLYAADDSIPEEYRITPKSANITPESAKGLFRVISEGAKDWKNSLLIGVPTGEEIPLGNGGIKKMFKLENLSDYKGHWIIYRGKKYKIPIK